MSKTTVTELKSLYIKLGGKLSDVAGIQTDAEIIDKIEDIINISGGGLPDVTEADAGKVLAVNSSGEWDAEEIETGEVYNSAEVEVGKLIQGSTEKTLYQKTTVVEIPAEAIATQWQTDHFVAGYSAINKSDWNKIVKLECYGIAETEHLNNAAFNCDILLNEMYSNAYIEPTAAFKNSIKSDATLVKLYIIATYTKS